MPESIIIVQFCSRRQGVMQGGAAIAQVIQVIADDLIGHDKADGLPIAITPRRP